MFWRDFLGQAAEHEGYHEHAPLQQRLPHRLGGGDRRVAVFRVARRDYHPGEPANVEQRHDLPGGQLALERLTSKQLVLTTTNIAESKKYVKMMWTFLSVGLVAQSLK